MERLRIISPYTSQETRTSVCVVGLGYIGLPTATVIADAGYEVTGVDIRSDVVDAINCGQAHIAEPDLNERVKSVVERGKLKASRNPVEADVFIICVPTPITKDFKPDLRHVKHAAESLRPFVRPGNLVLLESTSPPGTTERVVVQHAVPPELTVGRDISVAHSPERVLPGRILNELVGNDRIVGGVTSACTERAKQFYESFVSGKVWPTTAIVAEITKLVENASRDVNIAFANEISILADRFDVDPLEIIDLANQHPRVNILQPGPGVGGHCISVDPWFLIDLLPEQTPLMRTARQVNDQKPHFVVDKIERLAATIPNAVIGCLGLTYKANVDDLRESPALEIVRELRRRHEGKVLVHDPYVLSERFQEFPLSTLEHLLEQSDLLVLLTDHAQFSSIPEHVLRSRKVIDTRGLWRDILRHSMQIGRESRRDAA